MPISILTEISFEYLENFVHNILKNEENNDNDEDNSDDEMNVMCPVCNSENPISYNYCGFCRHPTRTQFPTTFAINTPQFSSRSNTNDLSS
jgi:hypothetical protein